MLNTTKQNIIPASTVMNTTIDSLAMQLQNAVNFSILVTFTGTPTGSFHLEMSCDPVPNPSLTFGANGVVTYVPTNWDTIDNSTFVVAAAGSVGWNYENCGFTYVRVVYADGSSGTSTAIITSSTFVSKGV
jgi:hypothetical protein